MTKEEIIKTLKLQDAYIRCTTINDDTTIMLCYYDTKLNRIKHPIQTSIELTQEEFDSVKENLQLYRNYFLQEIGLYQSTYYLKKY